MKVMGLIRSHSEAQLTGALKLGKKKMVSFFPCRVLT